MKNYSLCFLTVIVLLFAGCKGNDPIKPIEKFTVVGIAGTNGTITPSDTIVKKGESVTLTIAPLSDYTVDVFKVNGIVVPLTSGKYTLSNITSDQKVEVTFKKIEKFTITTTVIGGHGFITPTSVVVVKGESVTLTIAPIFGFIVDIFKVNSVVISLTSLNYAILNITSDTNIEVTFKYKYDEGTPEWYLTQFVWVEISNLVLFIEAEYWYEFFDDSLKSIFWYNPDGTGTQNWNNYTLTKSWSLDKTTNPITLIVSGRYPSKIDFLDDKKMILIFVDQYGYTNKITYTNDGVWRFK